MRGKKFPPSLFTLERGKGEDQTNKKLDKRDSHQGDPVASGNVCDSLRKEAAASGFGSALKPPLIFSGL